MLQIVPMNDFGMVRGNSTILDCMDLFTGLGCLADALCVTAGCDKTLDQSKYLWIKQSQGFPLWASSGFRNWQNA